MKKVVLSIAGMTCDHCEKAVKEALSKSGAMVESVSFAKGEAVCCFNPQQVTNEAIMKSVNQTANYKVTACKEC